MFNNVIAHNSSGFGGGIYASNFQPGTVFANNTIADNTNVGGSVGGMVAFYLDTTAENNIFWNNNGEDLFEADSNFVISYSLISNYQGVNGNFYADPLFVAPANDDYHLSANSPCIDSGTNTNAPATDIEGTLRPQGSAVDVGAYEYIPVVVQDTGTILVQAFMYYPHKKKKEKKEPFSDLLIRVYDKSPGSCAEGIGTSWQHYPEIIAKCDPVASAVTDENGQAYIEMPVGEYLVIGGDGTDKHLGRPTEVKKDETSKVRLKVVVEDDEQDDDDKDKKKEHGHEDEEDDDEEEGGHQGHKGRK